MTMTACVEYNNDNILSCGQLMLKHMQTFIAITMHLLIPINVLIDISDLRAIR